MSVLTALPRHNLRTLAAMKGRERVAMLTAYDVVTARCLDEAGADILLVGDSVGNVVYGFDTTLPVTLELMLAHTGAVVRGSQRALVVTDLPFMSYQVSTEQALQNAARCLAEAGAQAVKMEGADATVLQSIARLVECGIPVLGHIGLRPQSVHQMGGYYMHGKDDAAAERLMREALALQQAGCFAVVLECVALPVAREITAALQILTVGIGSGDVCDGEVLVINDVLGYSPGRAPKFAPPRADLKTVVTEAARAYVQHTKTVHAAPIDKNKVREADV